jgi:hypothetical protein
MGSIEKLRYNRYMQAAPPLYNTRALEFTYCKHFEGLDKAIAFEKGSDRFKVFNNKMKLQKVVRGHQGSMLSGIVITLSIIISHHIIVII